MKQGLQSPTQPTNLTWIQANSTTNLAWIQPCTFALLLTFPTQLIKGQPQIWVHTCHANHQPGLNGLFYFNPLPHPNLIWEFEVWVDTSKFQFNKQLGDPRPQRIHHPGPAYWAPNRMSQPKVYRGSGPVTRVKIGGASASHEKA